MKNQELVSIIIPTYNNEKSIENTIKNALFQTYRNIEIIIVNDASTDETENICKYFVKRDQRIILVSNNKNMGAGVSRNIGLKKAKGKYVFFVDADDEFKNSLIEDVIQRMEKDSAEVAVFGYETYELYSQDVSQHGYYDGVLECMDSKVLRSIGWAPWNKLFKRDFLEENSIEFQNIPNANDLFFVIKSLIKAKRISLIDGNYIRYTEGYKGSITYKRNIEHDYTIFAIEKIFSFMYEETIARSKYIEYFNYLIDTLAKSYLKKEKTNICRKRFIEDWHKIGFSTTCYSIVGVEKLYPHNREFIRMMDDKQIIDCEDYYSLYKESINEVFKKTNGDSIAIWGFGIQGKALYEFLKKNKFNIDYIIDIDKNKIKQAMAPRVYGPEYIEDKDPYILLTNIMYYEEVFRITNSNKIICLEKL